MADRETTQHRPPMPAVAADDARPTFIKALGLGDVVLMNIVAVVGLRWIPRGARAGAPSVSLWLLAFALFFLPLAAALAELSSRYPQQGGIYAWARRAFGPVHGFICGWCLWVNNLFYFPSLLLFGAANVLAVVGPRFGDLAENRAYSVVFVLIGIWFCVAISIVGLRTGRWVHNIGSAGMWVPATLLISAGAVSFAWFGSETTFAPSELVPREDFFATVSLWAAMCFAFSGFEISSLMGQEVKESRRTIPLGILIAGSLTTAFYMFGSMSILVAVPPDALTERTGITDAVDLVSTRVGLTGLGALTGGLLALGAVAGTASWTAGAARVPFAAGVDRVLPRPFARMHPRFHTPHVALVVQGLASTAIFLTSVFLTITGAETTIQEAYDILVNLTILIYFVPYLYLFASLLRLRRLAPAEPARGEIRVPGGRAGLWAAAGAGFLATAVSLMLVFIPPAGTENVLNYLVNLIVQAAVILAIGAVFYAFGGRGGRI